MRLISGTAGGIPLEVPKTVTRPTQDRVRQAIFSMLKMHIAHCLLLFHKLLYLLHLHCL